MPIRYYSPEAQQGQTDDLIQSLGTPSEALSPSPTSPARGIIGILKALWATLLERLPQLSDGKVPVTGQFAITVTPNVSAQVTIFNPSFLPVGTALVEIVSADPNRYKVFILNPASSTVAIKFVFADASDSPTANHCLSLSPGAGWIEEGTYTAAGKRIYAVASEETSILIWQWIQ